MSDIDTQFRYKLGQIVALRANPSVCGAVTEILPGEVEHRYKVFIERKPAFFYESQLCEISEDSQHSQILGLDEFCARMTAIQINQPAVSTLYSLNAARIDFVPYQFRPVLKFIRADRPRLLIADEVGVGKTIEAGLILRELQARQEVSSVLVICPKPLVSGKKWETELRRFDEQFEALEGPILRKCLHETDLDGEWPERYKRCIIPFSLCDATLLTGNGLPGSRNVPGLLELSPPPQFDLVIVDEAHHLRNQNTYLHQTVRFFCQHAQAVLFLTATPIQLSGDDLFVLLNLLNPDDIIDRSSFAYMSAPNPYINQAITLARTAQSSWESQAIERLTSAGQTEYGRSSFVGHPDYQVLLTKLSNAPLCHEDRLDAIREMERLHTFDRLINRTRRRDVGTEFATRKAETVEVPFTPEQQQLHDRLLRIQTRILQQTHDGRGVNFMMTTLRRQAASCLYGLAPMIRDILTRHMGEDEWLDFDDGNDVVGEDTISTVGQAVEEILKLVETLDGNDLRLAALLAVVQEKQALPNNKVLLFSCFIHTLNYLIQHLQAAGIRAELITGKTPDEIRQDLRDRFSLSPDDPRAIDVLLSSEVGCEGLDYQFCDCMINYDLPWNPMRIEQRIGRIDRYGQQSSVVLIYNFVTPGTIDHTIYHRCLWRIGVFQEALGGNEEILGQITRELRAVAENIEFTDVELQERLQQLADNEIRLLQEQERLEREQSELFGIVLPPSQLKQDVEDARSIWLAPDALENLIRNYLTVRVGGEGLLQGNQATKTLRLNEEARAKLFDDFTHIRRSTLTHRQWEKWLKGADPFLRLTFDQQSALHHRQTVFITPIHPLAVQAACQLSAGQDGTQALYRTVCSVRENTLKSGIHPFSIYLWRKVGIREEAELYAVCADQSVQPRLLALLQKAGSYSQDFLLPDDAVYDILEQYHQRSWRKAQESHLAYTKDVVQYRRGSLQASHRRRIDVLHEQLAKTTDSRIQRMKQSEITKAQADYARRLEEIECAEQQSDIFAELIATGILIVEGED